MKIATLGIGQDYGSVFFNRLPIYSMAIVGLESFVLPEFIFCLGRRSFFGTGHLKVWIKMNRLLIIDDEPSIVALFEHVFAGSDIHVEAASSAQAGLDAVVAGKPDAVMLDVVLPDGDGLKVFEQIKAIDSQLPVVIMTGSQDSETAIWAMQRGALDYLVKPLDVRSLNKVVRQALEVRRLTVEPIEIEPDNPVSGSSMIGSSPAMQEVYKAIGRVAAQNISVLILGESGTGKELVARAIYQHGTRKSQPFIALNCAAIPESLLESELFGHEKGAFTGADRRRIGKIEQCDGGTLFLDEIGDMEPPLQSKLLRVLQEKQFERVGGSETLTADVRILAATHRDIEAMCKRGRFREDLYYRLNGYTIRLPPLRERKGDLKALIEHFRKTANRELNKGIARVAPETIAILQNYTWPGNIRQLQSVIHQAVVQSTGTVLLPDFLPQLDGAQFNVRSAGGETSLSSASSTNDTSTEPVVETSAFQKMGEETLEEMVMRHVQQHSATLYDDVVEEVERLLIARVLDQCGGNLTEAARVLGITRTTVRTKINKLKIGIRRIVE